MNRLKVSTEHQRNPKLKQSQNSSMDPFFGCFGRSCLTHTFLFSPCHFFVSDKGVTRFYGGGGLSPQDAQDISEHSKRVHTSLYKQPVPSVHFRITC